MRKMLQADESVREHVSYDPLTGEFTRIKGPAHANKRADKATHFGYRDVMYNKQLYKAHRLAWFLYYGEWPKNQIDHINGDRSDNRIANLREATASENQANKRAWGKYKKGTVRSPSGRFVAMIRKNGQRTYLGTYDTEDEAHEVYCRHASYLHGEFARAQ